MGVYVFIEGCALEVVLSVLFTKSADEWINDEQGISNISIIGKGLDNTE